MADEPEDLTLRILRDMRNEQRSFQNDVIEVLTDLKVRMTTMKASLGNLTVQVAATNHRIDRLEERAGRIERRLELVDA